MATKQPVLLIIWRRSDTTLRVIDALRSYRPAEIYIASDGARENNRQEASLVELARQRTLEAIDWDCKIHTRFSRVNQGCRIGVRDAISWFFSNVSEGIILEDDCVPHPDFFLYCEELLNKFRTDEKVWCISGDGSPGIQLTGSASYGFIRTPLIWGWATWRRAWMKNDDSMTKWKSIRNKPYLLKQVFPDPLERIHMSKIYNNLADKGIPDTWDYQWSASCILGGGLCAIPARNLISNIGFGENATHTKAAIPRAFCPIHSILPLIHPKDIILDRFADSQVFEKVHNGFQVKQALSLRPPIVAHINSSDNIGGAARACYRIHQSLCKNNSQNKVSSALRVIHKRTDDPSVIGGAPFYSQPIDPSRLRRHSKPFSSGNPVLHSLAWPATGLAQEINQSNADIVHLHWLGSNTLSIEEIATINLPIVWTLHDQWPFCGAEHYVTPPPSLDRRFIDGYRHDNRPDHEKGFDVNRLAWRRKRLAWHGLSMHIHCTSSWMLECAENSLLFRDLPKTLIPCPLDTDIYKPIDRRLAREIIGIDPDKATIVFGAIDSFKDYRKGADLLVMALHELKAILPEEVAGNCQLLIFGQRDNPKDVGLGFPAHFAGKLGDDLSLRLHYAAGDLMIVPSRQEAFGQTASESHACGTPVVAFDAGGLRDIVLNGVTGFLAEPFNSRSLAHCIAQAFMQPDLLSSMSYNARMRAVRHWSYPIVAKQYIDMYAKVIASQYGLSRGSSG